MTEPRRHEETPEEAAAEAASEPGSGPSVEEAAAAGTDPVSQVAVPLEEQLASAERQRDEYLRDLQRMAADFDNYRKRTAREQEAIVARAHERLVKELLPILDDLERAAEPPVRDGGPREGVRGNRVEAPPTELEARLEAVLEGVRLVQRSLAAALAREGLMEIETDGKFDPHVHEALLSQPAEDAEEGTVLQVLQKGYRLGDRVVRPARVIVAA